MSWKRALVLLAVNLLIIVHIIQWKVTGTTISPIEPSEAMATLQRGAVNAGFIFFVVAIFATLIFGRFVCGWGCHVLALQDSCAWLMKKIGLRPQPFKSRVLVFVPLVFAVYMFVWPTVARWLTRPPAEPLFPAFTNHLVTTDFWATFAPIAVAIPFLFICGFMTVYFLGSKGFCTYACPYGGFFSLADKFSPGRIRVTDACHECGNCTSVCTSNVVVHKEVKEFGMVVDQGCMKCLDCVSACPNDALYFGFGKPAVGAGKQVKPNYSLTWPEEIFAVLIFAAALFAVWDVYLLVPMLMALGIAAVTAFVVMKLSQVIRRPNAAMFRFAFKSDGRWQTAGLIFGLFTLLWTALIIHSGFIRYHEARGTAAYLAIGLPDELALARKSPEVWLSPTDRESAARTVKHLGETRRYGLLTNIDALPKLAWAEFLTGDWERAASHLADAATRQKDQPKALSLYYRGAILSRNGRYEDAIRSFDDALAVRSDLVLALEERGEAEWRLGRREAAIKTWRDALKGNPRLPLSGNFLAAALAETNARSESDQVLKNVDSITPPDALYHWVLGQRLQGAGFFAFAERQFQRAIQINPQLKTMKR